MAATNLVIPVHASFQAKGSLKAIAEGIEATLINVQPMRMKDSDHKTHIEVAQSLLCPLQATLDRGSRGVHFPRVRVAKGDWIIHTPLGGLVLSPEEYDRWAETF